jgi:hypothetical protein
VKVKSKPNEAAPNNNTSAGQAAVIESLFHWRSKMTKGQSYEAWLKGKREEYHQEKLQLLEMRHSSIEERERRKREATVTFVKWLERKEREGRQQLEKKKQESVRVRKEAHQRLENHKLRLLKYNEMKEREHQATREKKNREKALLDQSIIAATDSVEKEEAVKKRKEDAFEGWLKLKKAQKAREEKLKAVHESEGGHGQGDKARKIKYLNPVTKERLRPSLVSYSLLNGNTLRLRLGSMV